MMQTKLIALSLTTIVSFALPGYGENTNENVTLFGVSVSITTPEAEAEFIRGHAYYTGNDVEQDYEKAVTHFRKSAELGYTQAQFNLGICHMNGTGVPQNDEEAARFLKQAAENGINEALYPLGLSYYNLEQYIEAYAWALLAESRNDTRLLEMLKPMYTEEEVAEAITRLEQLKEDMASGPEKAGPSTTNTVEQTAE